MPVKDNHKTLHRKIAALFAGPALFEPALRAARTCGKGHGRVEERTLVATGDVPAGYLDFPHVGQAFRLTRTRRRGGREQTETVYGLTSLTPAQAGPADLLALVRGHWHIETKSHWVRDVTFGEDRSQVRRGSIPQVMAAIRNACIGLMRAAGHTNIAAACRLHAARPRVALTLLGIPRTE
jgi:predicted transposase YbfD/YdcC